MATRRDHQMLDREISNMHRRHRHELEELCKRHETELRELVRGTLFPGDGSDDVCEFGEEDWSFMSEEEMRRMFADERNGILEAARRVYFDPQHPSNHTVRRKGARGVCVRKHGVWTVADLKETAQAIHRKVTSKLWATASDTLRRQVQSDMDVLEEDALYSKYMSSYWPVGIGLKPNGTLYDKAEQDALTRGVEFMISNSADVRGQYIRE